MSVIKHPSYADNPWQVAMQHIHPQLHDVRLCDRFLEYHTDGAGEFDERIKPGVMLNNYIRHPELYQSLHSRKRVKDWKAFANFLSEDIPVKFGLHGVYSLIGNIFPNIAKKETIDKGMYNFMRGAYDFGGAAASMTTTDVADRFAYGWIKSLHKLQPVFDLMREWVKVLAKSRRAINMIRGKTGEQFHWYKVGVKTAGVHIQIALLDNCHIVKYKNRHTFFTNDDFDRFRSTMEGIAMYDHYWRTYSVPFTETDPDLVDRAEKMLNFVCRTMRKITPKSAQKLTQAHDVVEHWELAELFSDVSDLAIKEHKLKWRDKKLDSCFDPDECREIVRGLKPREALQILQVHRAFPCPDFESHGQMKRQKDLYTNNVSKANDGGITGLNVMRNYKFYMMKAYRQKHRKWPGVPIAPYNEEARYARWPDNYTGTFSRDQVDEINLNGDFMFQKHHEDYMDLLKDKAVHPVGITRETTPKEYHEISRLEKSQILSILGLEVMPNLNVLRERVRELCFDVRADDKPEAKKPDGRWFFMLPAITRLLQSEYEASVDEYVCALEQVMFSTKPSQYDRIMNKLGGLEMGGIDALFISFDLSKWSPRITTEMHQQMDDLWAEAFGEDHLREMHRVVGQGDIHYFKGPIHHHMPKMGRDFEGFSGKKLTLYHLAVMHEVVLKLAEGGIVDVPARFMTFIDDGLLKLRKYGVWEPDQISEAIRIMTEVYRQSHLEISWDKTFVSRKWSVFLNRVYVYATPLRLGLKAYLKLNSRTEVSIPAISDDLETVAAKSSGALEAGALVYQVWFAYIYFVCDIVRKWAPPGIRLNSKHSIMLTVPISHGGLGIRNPQTLGATLASHPLADGWAAIRLICARYPGLKDFVDKLGNLPMVENHVGKHIRAPWAIRKDGVTIVQQRLLRAIEKGLLRTRSLPGLSVILSLTADNASDEVPAVLGGVVDLLAHKFMWDACRAKAISAVATKILKGNSAMSVIGGRAIFRVYMGNRANAAVVIGEWK